MRDSRWSGFSEATAASASEQAAQPLLSPSPSSLYLLSSTNPGMSGTLLMKAREPLASFLAMALASTRLLVLEIFPPF